MRQQLCQLMEENERQLEQLLAAHGKEIERITNIKESQLKSIERERNKAKKQLHELEEQLQRARDREKDTQLKAMKAANHKVAKGNNIKLRWRESALFADSRRRDAVVDGNQVYILDSNCHLWNYDINSKCWLQLAMAPYVCPGFAILDGLPTAIGGIGTNKLMSLTIKGTWTEKFPPMLTERYFVSTVCTRTDLIVAGGVGNNTRILTTVEVLNVEKYQWSTAVDLPEPLQHHSVTVCGDQLYMLGGARGRVSTKSVYTCSVSALLRTCTRTPRLVGTFQRALSRSNSSCSGVWSRLRDLPVRESTCVTFCGKLLAVGGEDSNNEPTTAVYMYNQDTNSWNINSHMVTRRQRPFAAVLPNNQLMVVGGETEIDDEWAYSDSVEFGNLC